MKKFLLGCDWGTSSFRLRLLDLQGEVVLAEVVSGKGIAVMHQLWHDQNAQNEGVSKVQFYKQYLREQISLLAKKNETSLNGVNLVISGMASSSIGMLEVPYATLPYATDGSNAVVHWLHAGNSLPHEVILVSGVRSDNDVMRGEETQLIGLLKLLEKRETKPTDAVFVFPGTHSKHILVENGRITNFRTFMTGEVFNVMARFSILKNSVQITDITDFSVEDVTAFKMGIREARKSGILNGLFTVRTNDLFNKLSKKQNGLYLSGLLIGEELNYLSNRRLPVFLCGGSNLHELYRLAFEVLSLTDRATIVPFELVDKAASEGQRLIYQNHILKDRK